MTEELVQFETAVLAKEKECDLISLHFYVKPSSKMFGLDEKNRSYSIKNIPKKLYTIGEHATLSEKNVYYAPTQSLLSRWLREVHKIYISPMFIGPDTNKYQYRIDIEGSGNTGEYSKWFTNFEECFEEGLVFGLKLIK